MNNGVLIVDEDVNAGIIAGTLLDVRDIRFCVADDSQRAREIMEREHPAVVIVDLAVAAANGFALLRQVLRPLDPAPAVRPPRLVIVTEQTEPEVEHFVQRLGVDGFLRKPFDPGRFIETVEHLLAGARHGTSGGSSGWHVEAL